MLPLYEDPHFTFRFADDRIIRRFHLEGVEAGRRVGVARHDDSVVDHGDRRTVEDRPIRGIGLGVKEKGRVLKNQY